MVVFSSKRVLKYALSVSYIKSKPRNGILTQTGSNTVFLTILVSLMIIETTTDLPDEGGGYNKDDSLLFSSVQNIFEQWFVCFLMEKVSPEKGSRYNTG